METRIEKQLIELNNNIKEMNDKLKVIDETNETIASYLLDGSTGITTEIKALGDSIEKSGAPVLKNELQTIANYIRESMYNE